MQAIVYDEYGPPDVLRLETVDNPVPDPDEVLIDVHASSLNAVDRHMVRGSPFLVRFVTGLRAPRHGRLGADVAGTVEAIGADVERFRPGDAVFGDLSRHGWGALAEYVCVPEDAVIETPADTTFQEAAALPMAAVTALQALRDTGRIESGDRVAINGASGGVGTFAVQIAMAFDAEVTGVCSGPKAETVRSIGADHVIDYTTEDFTDSSGAYDLIIDTAGSSHPIAAYRRALDAEGVYVLIGGASTARIVWVTVRGMAKSVLGGKSTRGFMARPNRADLETISELIESGSIAPVIDSTYPLGAVPEAIRHLEAGGVTGKVVIDVDDT